MQEDFGRLTGTLNFSFPGICALGLFFPEYPPLRYSDSVRNFLLKIMFWIWQKATGKSSCNWNILVGGSEVVGLNVVHQ